jgi:hypothetical protein
VNRADHSHEDYVYLLDDGIVRLEADGRSVRTFRQVVQILTQAGVARWGELALTYTGGSERLTVNWARIVDRAGRVISAQPAHQQESVAPAAREAPVYSDARVRQLTLSGVAPGTILDFSFTTERPQPVMPGDFAYTWLVTMGELTRRSRFILDVPIALRPRVKERNISFAHQTVDVGGRRVYTWATAELPKIEREPFAADSNGVYQSIAIAAPVEWGDVARWYARLARDRYTVTPSLDSALTSVVAGARTGDDSLQAVHRWVAQDFRYVSLALGLGGYQPRAPAAVLETKYGDCKDKATLFIALAQRMGVAAYPVLLRVWGHVERDQPSVRAFDHMIAAVARPSGYVYVDLTADLTPFGTLPPPDEGRFGLVVHPDGREEEVTLPVSPISANQDLGEIVGELTPNGLARGRLTLTAAGAFAYPLREALGRSYSTDERDRLARVFIDELYPGAISDGLEVFDARDLHAEPRVSITFHDGRASSPSGQGDILTLPFHESAASPLLAALETNRPRRFPIDVADVIGPGGHTWDLRLTLPEGWHAQLPQNVSATSEFGSYTATYSQAGRLLTVTHQITGARGVRPQDRITALVSWLRDVARDDVHYVVLQH